MASECAAFRRKVIVASNRAMAPDLQRRGSRGRTGRGAGGLVRVIDAALGPGDRWVALTGDDRGSPPKPVGDRPRSYQTTTVPLGRRTRQLHEIACNRVLWFALHGLELPSDIRFTDVAEAWEDGYRRVSQVLASGIAAEWRRSPATILLQDYHLYVTAPAVRALVPTARVGLFSHVPFMGPRAFHGLPLFVVTDILRGMLACDLLGFQAERDLAGFVQACSVYLGALGRDNTVEWGGRTVRLGVWPAPVDAATLAAEDGAATDDRHPFPTDDTIICWAGRSDPAKNPVGAIESFRRMLELEPSLVGRVRLVMKVHPSRQHLPEYRACLERIQEAAARLNAELAREGWVPVAVDLSPERSRLICALRRADVVFVNSLADGMNLVVQEAALISRRTPAVVLSRTTGAYEHMWDCVIPLDPQDPVDGARALADAVRLPMGERLRRLSALRSLITRHTPRSWLAGQAAALTDDADTDGVIDGAEYELAVP